MGTEKVPCAQPSGELDQLGGRPTATAFFYRGVNGRFTQNIVADPINRR